MTFGQFIVNKQKESSWGYLCEIKGILPEARSAIQSHHAILMEDDGNAETTALSHRIALGRLRGPWVKLCRVINSDST